MAIDEKLSEQVRAALADALEVTEVKMFGGIGFMLAGNMVAAASDRGLLVRVGKDAEANALSRPGAGHHPAARRVWRSVRALTSPVPAHRAPPCPRSIG